MPREHNYLLGQGERLAEAYALSSQSRTKTPPYLFERARDRLVAPVSKAADWASQLPGDACPDDRVVIEVVIHPRYLSKSEQPATLISAFGGKTIGRKAVEVSPEAWGTKTHPKVASSDKLFVAVKRNRLKEFSSDLPTWDDRHTGSKELTQVESLSPAYADNKLMDKPPRGEYLAEVVLHNAGDRHIIESFRRFAQEHGATVLIDRQRANGWLTFVPVRLTDALVTTIAQFAFVRALRTMPRLRSVVNSPMRSFKMSVKLPDADAVSSEKAVIFDGGLPPDAVTSLSRWVTHIEPPGIGPADPEMQIHGLGVTSSFLFGPLKKGVILYRPACTVDHVRVIDDQTGGDLEYYDVLERITDHLDRSPAAYRFGCLSLGPRRAITDDEVTAWTAELDSRLAHGETLMAVAVGNDGDLDRALGLNRIQPPSDGVNVFSVGACDSRGKTWNRAPYSCTGPGRSPGIFKPEVLAFGGTEKRPFEVLGPLSTCLGVTGTSFAAPLALRSCASVASLVETRLSPLTLRALAVHRAEGKRGKSHANVGWGRMVEGAREQVTCDDCEAVVVYQGDLPLGQHLRAKLALPKNTKLLGPVEITATLAIAPEVDPEHASTYTRGGLGITFRPDAEHFELNEKGEVKAEPETVDFFNTARLKGRVPEYILRKDAHKWETVLRAKRNLDASALNEPFFDIFYNRRMRGATQQDDMPLRYALIVTVRCEAVPTLYELVVQDYLSVLSPLQVASEVTLQL